MLAIDSWLPPLGGARQHTSFLTCWSSAESSGSLGVDSLSAFFSSASFFLDLALELLESAALVDLGVAVAPLAALGVALVVNLILGFLTESARCGVCSDC